MRGLDTVLRVALQGTSGRMANEKAARSISNRTASCYRARHRRRARAVGRKRQVTPSASSPTGWTASLCAWAEVDLLCKPGGDSSGIRPRTMTMRRGHSDCREIAPSGGDSRRANFRANQIVTQGLHIIARPVDVWPTARISLLASCLSITAGSSNAGR